MTDTLPHRREMDIVLFDATTHASRYYGSAFTELDAANDLIRRLSDQLYKSAAREDETLRLLGQHVAYIREDKINKVHIVRATTVLLKRLNGEPA
jgi:hypothetical protein